MQEHTEKHAIQSIPSTTRIEQFSDGVLSIVITLLVFQIALPEKDTILTWGSILKLVPTLTTFALSFFIIAVYWIKHHQLFHILHTSDRKLLWWNIHFLFWIALAPFASSLLGHHFFEIAATAVYGFVMMSISISFYILRYHATNKKSLHYQDIPKMKLRIELRKLGFVSVIYIIGFGISFLAPIWATVIYFSTALLSIVKIPKTAIIFLGID